jgi:hypothetical protein
LRFFLSSISWGTCHEVWRSSNLPKELLACKIPTGQVEPPQNFPLVSLHRTATR